MMTDLNLQALKGLSCFTAVTFFSTSQICNEECFLSGTTLSVLYYLSVVSKPLFFIIMGYMDEVESLTRKQVAHKIHSIIIIILFWNLILSIVANQHIQQGYILQNGLLVGMGVIYLAYPLILTGLKRLKLSFLIFMSLVAAIAAFDFFHPINSKNDPLFITGYSYSWVWVGYYITGHLLGESAGRRITGNEFSFKLARIMLIPIGLGLYFNERQLNLNSTGNLIIGFILEHTLLLSFSLALFIVFKRIKITAQLIIRTIEFISPAMIGVYIVHYSVFNLFYAVYDFKNSRMGILLTIMVFVASVLLSRLFLLNSLSRRIITF